METARHRARARRNRVHLPRGHPHPVAARSATPRRGVGRLGARDRRGGRPCRGARHRARAPRIADSAAQGEAPRRAPDDGSRGPSIRHRRSPPPSPTGSGRTSSSSGSGSAGCRPLRKAAVIGAGSWGTAMAVLLARGGLDVQLGTRSEEKAAEIGAKRENHDYLPGVTLPENVSIRRAVDIELAGVDLVCLAVPSAALPAVVGALGDRVGSRAAVLLLTKGLVQPLGQLPSEYVGERIRSRAIASLGGPAHAREAAAGMAALVLGDHGRRPALPARRGLRPRGAGLRAERRRRRGRDGGRGEERRGARRCRGGVARPERGGDRRRDDLAGVRRVRPARAARAWRRSPAWPESAT